MRYALYRLCGVSINGRFQNIGDLGTLRGEMLGNTGYVHGDTSRLHVGVYGYDGIRVERTDGIRAGRRPCSRDVDRVDARCGIGVSNRLAVDNIRDIGDHTITPVHRRVEHATRGIATYGES